MCGLGGILLLAPPRPAQPHPVPHARPDIPDTWIDALDAAIVHRGPDGLGRFRGASASAQVALAHRRLSIIDLQGGGQPMVDWCPNSTIAVAFNGCIYNHRDLRRELIALGAKFATDHSDTEVLIHGWRAWGDGLWARLDGMFAVALWDERAGRLVLARDPAGEKPLWFARITVPTSGATALVFASTARAVERAVRRIDPGSPALAVDPHRLAGWLALGFGPDSPLAGINALPPGTFLDAAAPSHPRPFAPRTRRADRPRLSPDRVLDLVSSAVASRLEADVPLGCFLSGGVDSSLVAALARRTLGERGLDTFCVRMPDPRLDESAYAQAVAHHLGTRHHTLDCLASPADDLARLIPQMGLPLGDSSLLPTFWVSRAASQFATVCLSGDGGDELFGGYDRYLAARWLRRASDLIATWPLELALHPRLNRLIRAARGAGYPDLLRLFSPELAGVLLSAALDPQSLRRSAGDDLDPDADPLTFDFRTYLPGDLLLKVDSASMSVPIEVRAPLLANAVREAALAEPLRSLMPRGRRKGLLRAAARRVLPSAIIDRRKQGFAIPVGAWLRSDFGGLRTLAVDLLRSADPWPGLGINRGAAGVILDEHMTGGVDHGQRLYALVILSLWARSMGQGR